MNRNYFVCFILILFSFNLQAQQLIKGSVIDALSNKPLAGSHISIENKNLHTVSDENGNFEIKLKAEKNSAKIILKIQHIGYKTLISSIETSGLNRKLEFPLRKLTVNMKEVFVSASRKPENIDEIAASTAQIDKKEIESWPASNVDNILQSVANVYVNRSWGIYSKNASLTMRGLDGKDRVLILYDGVPMNKAGGGSINWHLINPDQIERIEVIKGPGSAIYGNNAMNGVINIITKKPDGTADIFLKAFASSFNTFGGSLNAGKQFHVNEKNLGLNFSAFYRKGDGYYFEPEQDRDFTSAKLNLEEYNAHLKLDFELNSVSNIELSSSFQHDMRGAGTKIYTHDGSFNSYTTFLNSLAYNSQIKNTSVKVQAFAQYEDYLKQSENISSNSGKYKLSESPQTILDYGVSILFSSPLRQKHDLTYGADYKEGMLSAEDIYRTSSDYIERKGNLSFGGVFIQDNWHFAKKLMATIGLRYDYARFHSGSILVTEPTSNTGFTEDYSEDYPESSWTAFSPKLSLKYTMNSDFSAYISAAKGFRPPSIDDMCSSRKISKGFKIANPYLKPEHQTTFELGSSFSLIKDWTISSAIYYTKGYDFQYFVGTGDYVDTGGSSLKPVLKRENISQVSVKGVEFDVSYRFNKFLFKANYAYNQSVIEEFKPENNTLEQNLEGKSIIETPANQAFASLARKNKVLTLNLVYNYIGEQWLDDENTLFTKDYHLLDFRISRVVLDKIRLAFDIQNLGNVKYVDKKGYEAPGRFLTFEVGYSF